MKKIKIEITVPSGDYCLEYISPFEKCEHLENKLTFPVNLENLETIPFCRHGFNPLTKTKNGIVKPIECLKR